MKEGKITVGRLWSRYEGKVPSRAPVVLGMDRQKYRTICIYLKESSEAANYFEEKGCKVFYISKKRFFRVFNLPAVCKLARILKQEKVGILHCHRHQATVYGAIAAKLAGVPVVFSHVHGLSRSKNPRRKLINRIVLRWVNKILTVGEAVRSDVLTNNFFVPSGKVVSLGNSIAYERFGNISITKQRAKENIGLRADSVVFGTVGRMAPNKGHIYLIKAFVKVKQSLDSAELVFVGDGRLAKELKSAAEKTGLSDSIHFLGQRNDVPEILPSMDAFVLPSIGSEGLPRCLLEAMAAGVPCVGTTISGIPEILEGGEYGRLVPARDAAGLARAMIETAQMSRQERHRLVQSCRQMVGERYNHNVVIAKLEGIYQQELETAAKTHKNFSNYVKFRIDLRIIETTTIPVKELHAQYNPYRFEKYRSLHAGPSGSVLDMRLSPHCRLLEAYQQQGERIHDCIKDFAYYKMLRRYGKSKKRALERVRRFIELHESIKTEGFTSKIVVSRVPFVENEYNKGYEIYEGHHRVACCIALGIENVPADIVEA